MTQEKLTPNAIRDRAEVLPLTNPSEGFMEAPLFARKGLNKKDVDKLIKVMIEMPNDPEGRQILLSSKISGFVKSDRSGLPARESRDRQEGEFGD